MNNKETVERLYRENQRIVNYLFKIWCGKTGLDRTDLRCLIEEGLHKASERYSEDKGKSFFYFALRTINNHVIDNLRKENSYRNKIEKVKEREMYKENFSDLYEALSDLPLGDRRIIYRRYFEKATLQEIAKEEEITVAELKEEMEQILEKLQKLMKK